MKLTVLAAALLIASPGTLAQTAAPAPVVVATGLSSPMGVLVAPDGSVWAIDSGTGGPNLLKATSPETGKLEDARAGDTTRVVRVGTDGKQSVVATLPSIVIGTGPQAIAEGGARLAIAGGSVFVTSGGWTAALAKDFSQRRPLQAAIVKIEDGRATEVANLWDIESSQNPDGTMVDTHPYGLATGPDGMLYVADAGANALFRVDPATGKTSLVVTFAGLPGPGPNPERGGKNEVDPVPTAVVPNADGSFYVSFLPGGPPIPGIAKVVKVTADGKVSDFANGLTYATDLRRGPDGSLYAVQIARFTDKGPVPNSGSLVRIQADGKLQTVLEGLPTPSSVDFNAAGDAYLTINTLAAPGAGQVVMYKGIAAKSR